jgi:hypothetical protein
MFITLKKIINPIWKYLGLNINPIKPNQQASQSRETISLTNLLINGKVLAFNYNKMLSCLQEAAFSFAP